MYRIPADIDLSDIVGSEIQQVCLGRYDVQFHFASGRTISVQGDVEVLEHDSVLASWNENDNWSSTGFQQLLNTTVKSYSVPNDRLLEINFDRNLILRLYDSSDQYESMQIYPGGTIV